MVIYTETFRADFKNAYLYIVKNFHDDIAAGKLAENTVSTLNRESDYISLTHRPALAIINNNTYYRVNINKHVAIHTIRSKTWLPSSFVIAHKTYNAA